MINYILADSRRIFRKKSFIITFCAYFALFLIMVFIYFNPSFTSDSYVAKTKTFIGYFPFIIGLVTFLSVYFDDFKSKSMQVAIGFGLPRYKVVLSKFLESMILLFLSIFCVFALSLITPIFLGISLNHSQIMELFVNMIAEWLRTIGYFSISTIPIFYTQNALSGTIFYVLLSSKTILLLLTMILGQEIFVHIFGNLTQYLYTTQLYAISSEFIKNGSIGFSLIWSILFYILFPVMLSVISFNKKELEF